MKLIERILKILLKRSRYTELYAELIDSYKKEYNYSINENAIQQMIGYNDSTVIGGEMKGLLKLVIIQFLVLQIIMKL